MTGETVEESLATRAGRLFAEYRTGSDASMGALVQLLTPILWHTVRTTRLDKVSAEDVLQNVWLALVRKADSITEPQAVLQWMIISTKREAWHACRDQARVLPQDMEADRQAKSDAHPSAEDDAIGSHAEAMLWAHITALPERCRTLLRVIAFADRPDYAQLSEALGMPPGSIGPTRGRCLAKLRISLAEDSSFGHDLSGGLR